MLLFYIFCVLYVILIIKIIIYWDIDFQLSVKEIYLSMYVDKYLVM